MSKINLPHYPEPFMTKEDAIKRAKELESIHHRVCVLKSTPTELGKAFYVEPIDTMIRVHEKVVYKSK